MAGQRAALGHLVERMEFDPATGEGRMHYRIGANGTRFRLDTVAADLGWANRGITGVPTGIRTPVTAVKGRCPRPLDDGDCDVSLWFGWWR